MKYPIHFIAANKLTCEFPTEAVILANGEYPRHAFPLQQLQEAPYVVCCDGASNTYLSQGKVPDVIIGDGDSLNASYRETYRQIIHHIEDQECNDLTKAVRFLKEQGKQHIVIVGATGKREDHTLGNISLLMEFQRMGLQVCMLTDYGVFVPCQGEQSFSVYIGQQLSIFNFTAQGLHAEGLVYPLRDFSSWWEGTLNEVNRTTCTFYAEGEYLVFLNY